MKILIILSFVLLGCYGPMCEYQEMCSCEIYTDGDKRFATLKVKGCHLCCWMAQIVICEGMTPDSITELSKKFYWQVVESNPECHIEGEDCGASWSYGLDIDRRNKNLVEF